MSIRYLYTAPARLLSSNTKLKKGDGSDWQTLGLQLAPSDLSGRNVCPHSSAGCRAACLFTAGRGTMPSVANARINKTHYFIEDRDVFLAQLHSEITRELSKALRKGKRLAIRLNVISDIPWENVLFHEQNLMELFPDVIFYDYTKSPDRARRYADGELPSNYHLTFSRSECNQVQVESLIGKVNIAVVFRGQLPEKYLGRPVVDGDKNDMRFLDPSGVVVGLTEKGLAKKDESGFVLEPNQPIDTSLERVDLIS